MNLRLRNLLVFCTVAVLAGWLGIALNLLTGNTAPPMESLGALVWLLGPTITGLFLRWKGGDGFGDDGLCPNLPLGWQGYLAALLLYPAITLIGLAASTLFGTVTITGLAGDGLRAYGAAVGAMFLATLFKNVFEELAWRGYLYPRLQAAGLGPMVNYAVTAVVWWAWHLPYYYYFLSRADLAAATPFGITPFLALGLLVLWPTAAFFGEVRQASGSVWSAVLLHALVNAISMPLVLDGFIHTNNWGSLFISPTNDSVLMAILMGAAAWWLHRRNQKLAAS